MKMDCLKSIIKMKTNILGLPVKESEEMAISMEQLENLSEEKSE